MQFLGGGRGGMHAWGGKSAPGPFPREGDTAKPPPRFVRAVRMLTKSTDWQSVEKARKPRKQTCIQGSLHRRK